MKWRAVMKSKTFTSKKHYNKWQVVIETSLSLYFCLFQQNWKRGKARGDSGAYLTEQEEKETRPGKENVKQLY